MGAENQSRNLTECRWEFVNGSVVKFVEGESSAKRFIGVTDKMNEAGFYDVQVSMVTRYRVYAESVSKAVTEAQEQAKFMLTEFCRPVISVFVESIRRLPEEEVDRVIPRYVKGE